MSAMVPTLRTPKPYVPRSHPVILATEPARPYRCHACHCLVSSTHVPASVECDEARDMRLESQRADG